MSIGRAPMPALVRLARALAYAVLARCSRLALSIRWWPPC